VPCAFVVAAEGAAPAERELQDHVRSHLSPHKYPREVRFVGDLPRTGSGKVDRRALRTIETAKESV
jgi:acyl-coenzyme A synthetase/AMP-(fatty) acid ligase